MQGSFLKYSAGLALVWLTIGFSSIRVLAIEKSPNDRQDSPYIANNTTEITSTTTDTTSDADQTEQLTSVSQLSDVQPTDWAFPALQSLIEHYGCIVGYPSGKYLGNRVLTRYEFAAALNACLNRINDLIANSSADFIHKSDLETIQHLQTEYSAELATLRGRVDAFDTRISTLEAHQFSTTSKLSGEVIMAGIAAGGGAPGSNSNAILTDRIRLNLTTSFTGKDLLLTGLQAYDFLGGTSGAGSLQNSLGLSSGLLSASSARTSFEPQFPGLNVNTLSPLGANAVQVYKLLYVFPVAHKLTLFAGTAAEATDAFPAIDPFYGEGQEAVSRFAGLNPVVRISGGTSGTGLASAAGFIYSVSPKVDLRALYGSVNANLPQDLGVAGGTPLGAGVFSGSSVVATQLTLKPISSLDIGLNYAHSYHEINILGTGLTASDVGTGLTSGALANVALTTPVTLNSVGGTFNWRFAPKVSFAGYGAAIFADSALSSVNAATTFTSWMFGLHFKDLLQNGNTAGLLFGQPLFRSDASGTATLAPTGANRATPYQLEAYYRYQVNPHVSVTPGVFVLFNPESDSNNDTTTVGVLRTTFTF